MAAFCVKTAERNLVFAAMKDEGTVWVERLCEVAFQVRQYSDWFSSVKTRGVQENLSITV